MTILNHSFRSFLARVSASNHVKFIFLRSSFVFAIHVVRGLPRDRLYCDIPYLNAFLAGVSSARLASFPNHFRRRRVIFFLQLEALDFSYSCWFEIVFGHLMSKTYFRISLLWKASIDCSWDLFVV